MTLFKKNMTIHIEHHTVVEAAVFECVFGGQRREPTVPEHRLTSQRWSCTRLFHFIVMEKTNKTKWHTIFFFIQSSCVWETGTFYNNYFCLLWLFQLLWLLVCGYYCRRRVLCSQETSVIWNTCGDLWSCVVHLKKTAQICTLSTLFKTWMHK